MKLLENKYINFAYRNAIWVGLILISLWLLSSDWIFNQSWIFQLPKKEFAVIVFVTTFEGLALGLSGIAVFVFTNINFMKELTAGKDKKYSVYERQALTNTIGRIFMGVHLLVGLCVYSIYLARFSGA